MNEPVGRLPGHENVTLIIECRDCRSQIFEVHWIAKPVMKGAGGEPQYYPPGYALKCCGCQQWWFMDPAGPEPKAIRSAN